MLGEPELDGLPLGLALGASLGLLETLGVSDGLADVEGLVLEVEGIELGVLDTVGLPDGGVDCVGLVLGWSDGLVVGDLEDDGLPLGE